MKAITTITTSRVSPPEPTAVNLVQLEVGDPKKHLESTGTVKTAGTRPFWCAASVSPRDFGHHWNYNGDSKYLTSLACTVGISTCLQAWSKASGAQQIPGTLDANGVQAVTLSPGFLSATKFLVRMRSPE